MFEKKFRTDKVIHELCYSCWKDNSIRNLIFIRSNIFCSRTSDALRSIKSRQREIRSAGVRSISAFRCSALAVVIANSSALLMETKIAISHNSTEKLKNQAI